MDSIKSIIAIGILLTAAFIIGRCEGRKEGIPVYCDRVDTLVISDTIMQYEPVYKEIHKVEKVLVPVTDTLRVTDTLYVYLDREQVVWQDSLSVVYASGVMPAVDSVRHYVTERIVYNEVIVPQVKRTRWGIGVHAGYGIGVNSGKVVASPYIGVGLSYNLLTW